VSSVRPFTIVDVGARWGVSERWADLGNDFRVIAFEPDEDECRRLAERQPTPTSLRTVYVPTALGRRRGKLRLHQTVEPACSSSRPPRNDLVGTLPELGCMRTVGTTLVPVTTLDRWCADNGVTYVDAIKIDTQGSELEVLRGGSRILRTTSLVQVEVQFNELYEGVRLFADVDRHLRRAGFALWRLDNLAHHEPAVGAHAPTEFTVFHDSRPSRSTVSGGQLFWGDAYYVRSQLVPGARNRPDQDDRRRASCVVGAAGLPDLAASLASSIGATDTYDGRERDDVRTRTVGRFGVVGRIGDRIHRK
jgi:FkbM family methyltransferase